MTRILYPIIILLLLSVSNAEDWPEFRHDSGNTGFNPIDVNARILLWTYSAEDWFESSPILYEGILYIASYDGIVYAFNSSTGSVKWTLDLGDKVKASAAASNGKIFIGCYDGFLYAIDSKTGRIRWMHKTASAILSSAST